MGLNSTVPPGRLNGAPPPGAEAPGYSRTPLRDPRPDDASSRAPRQRGDETTGKSPPPAEICPGGTEKAGGGAPIQEELPW